MATAVTLTGTILLPDGTAPQGGQLRFQLTATDTDQTTRDSFAIGGSSFIDLEDGAIPAGTTIWPNTAGLAGSSYDIYHHWIDAEGRKQQRVLAARRTVSDESDTVDIAELIDAGVTAPDNTYVMTITVDEYNAVIEAEANVVEIAAEFGDLNVTPADMEEKVGQAAASASAAEQSANDASDSADLAESYAQEAEDSPVSGGSGYSALHHAAKAAGSATAAETAATASQDAQALAETAAANAQASAMRSWDDASAFLMAAGLAPGDLLPLGKHKAKTGELWTVGGSDATFRPHPFTGQPFRAEAVDATLSAPALKDPFSRDITDALQTAMARNLDFVIPDDGDVFTISDTIEVGNGVKISGNGRTRLRVLDEDFATEVFRFGSGKGGYNKLSGFIIANQNAHASDLFRITADRAQGPQWKNLFERIYAYRFKTAITFDGFSQEDWASENTFLSCKFVNCRTGILAANDQAVNNTFYQCDFENYDETVEGVSIVDAQNDILKITRGGAYNFHDCSLIGRGSMIHYVPDTGTTPFSAGHINIESCRAELRSSNPTGSLYTTNGWIYQDPAGEFNNYRELTVNVKNTLMIMYGGSIDLARYRERLTLNLDGVTARGGRATVRQFPTSRTYTYPYGVNSRVTISDNCSGITSAYGGTNGEVTPYGTIDTASASPVNDHGRAMVSITSQNIDDVNFVSVFGGGSAGIIGRGYAKKDSTRMVYTGAGTFVADLLFIAPHNGKPYKWGLYKYPSSIDAAPNYELWIVKNKADWVNPAALDFATDAYNLGETGGLGGFAGGKEFFVNFPTSATVLGSATAGVSPLWSEGRMAIRRKTGTTVTLTGHFWIDFW